MKNILIITDRYPYQNDMSFNFVRNTVVGLADSGFNCIVLCPQSFSQIFLKKIIQRPSRWLDYTSNGAEISVYQPKTLTFSSRNIFGFSLSSFFTRSIRKAYTKFIFQLNIDVIYAHFWGAGFQASQLPFNGKDVPIIVISGESTVCNIFNKDDSLLKKIKGVICVSSKNLIDSQKLGLLKYNPKTEVVPNAVDPCRFYKIPQDEARNRIGIVSDNNIVGIFVGFFNERKGIDRVLTAAKKIPNLKLICVGKSEGKYKILSQDKILFCGSVKNEDLKYYLNSADFFVLPTIAEGCCNAILEALACGLPIVSSNLPFNNEILDDTCSIRVDPNNVEELTEAMKTLCDSEEKRTLLAEGALEKVKSFLIQNRIARIVSFFEDVCRNNKVKPNSIQ